MEPPQLFYYYCTHCFHSTVHPSRGFSWFSVFSSRLEVHYGAPCEQLPSIGGGSDGSGLGFQHSWNIEMKHGWLNLELQTYIYIYIIQMQMCFLRCFLSQMYFRCRCYRYIFWAITIYLIQNAFSARNLLFLQSAFSARNLLFISDFPASYL